MSNLSKLEEQIASLLAKDKVIFEREVHLPYAKWKKDLRYDFGIFKNDELVALIEVQGEQHYRYVSKFYKSQQDFSAAQERDRKKIKAALAQNIPLYIIPFNEIPAFYSSRQIFSDKFLAKSMWHNDTHNPYLYEKSENFDS